MAMDADDGLAGLKFLHVCMEMRDEFTKLIRNRPSDCVGNVHRVGASLHDSLADFHQEFRLGAGTILW